MKIKPKKGDVCTFEEYVKPASTKPNSDTWGALRNNPEDYRELYPQIDWQSEKSHTVTMTKEKPLTVHMDAKGETIGYEFWCMEEEKLSRFLTTNLALLGALAQCDWGMTGLRGKTLKISKIGGEAYRVEDLTEYVMPSGRNSSQDKKYWKPEGV